MRAFDHLFSVSDVHLGGEGERSIFTQGKALAALIDAITARTITDGSTTLCTADRVGLVLNGDIIDFLAEPNARSFNASRAVEMVRRIAEDSAFAPVFTALSEYLAAENNHLIWVMGNHDVELALPDVIHAIEQRVTGGDPTRRGRLEWNTDGTGYRCSVGRRSVLFLHGNQADPFNNLDWSGLRKACAKARLGGVADDFKPSGGALVVTRGINKVKREYPFVDLLQPGTAEILTTLTALDISLDGLRTDIARVLGRTGIVAARGRFLGEGGTRTQADEDSAEDIFARVQGHLDDDDDGRAVAEEGTLGLVPAAWKRGVGRLSLKRSARQWGRLDDLSTVDTTAQALLKMVDGGTDILVAGHTHHPRELLTPSKTAYYINTGTWADTLTIETAALDSKEVFRELLADLHRGDRTALRSSGHVRLRRDRPVCWIHADHAGLYQSQHDSPSTLVRHTGSPMEQE